MSEVFNRPIPGQSLTDEPKNYPWERPPEITEPNEAVRYHLDRISDPEVIDNIFYALDMGIPVKVLTDSMMTGAVGKGVHDIDKSLLIERIVRKAVMKMADAAGVEYRETFDKEELSATEKAAMLVRAVEKTPEEERDKGFELLKEISETATSEAEPSEEPDEESNMMNDDDVVVEDKPKGLMAR
tara:strand:+ start:380 stop:934 length:555 start_codon:yes stop_codon:yes gene_type:complete